MFYIGVDAEHQASYMYEDLVEHFENPSDISLIKPLDSEDSVKNLLAYIRPCLLPAGTASGRKSHLQTYEFYHHVVVARQLGFGQLPPQLFLAQNEMYPIQPLLKADRVRAGAHPPSVYMSGLPREPVQKKIAKRKDDAPTSTAKAESKKKKKAKLSSSSKPSNDNSEDIEHDIDEAAASIEDTDVAPSTQQASTSPPHQPSASPTIQPLTSPVQHPSASPERAPSAPLVQSPECILSPSPSQQPSAIPSDDFGFDINEFVEEEEITSQQQGIPDELNEKLQDISDRLEVPIDTLVADIGSVKSRILEIQDKLDFNLAKSLVAAAHLDAYQIPIARSHQQMLDRQNNAN
uniref:DUF1409 domain-containing protein n=1 Tax=Leersia perrieri TaxID=77586 RepID=A0A0D9XYJ7_9ORYZ